MGEVKIKLKRKRKSPRRTALIQQILDDDYMSSHWEGLHIDDKCDLVKELSLYWVNIFSGQSDSKCQDPRKWGIAFSNSALPPYSLAICDPGLHEIMFALWFLAHNDWHTVKRIVAHEVAHVHAGSKNSHCELWETWARRMGDWDPQAFIDSRSINYGRRKH